MTADPIFLLLIAFAYLFIATSWRLYIDRQKQKKATIAKADRERVRITTVVEEVAHRLGVLVPPKER